MGRKRTMSDAKTTDAKNSIPDAQTHAWQRIGDLVEAIRTEYMSADGSPALVEKWAKEIVLQSRIIRSFANGDDAT